MILSAAVVAEPPATCVVPASCRPAGTLRTGRRVALRLVVAHSVALSASGWRPGRDVAVRAARDGELGPPVSTSSCSRRDPAFAFATRCALSYSLAMRQFAPFLRNRVAVTSRGPPFARPYPTTSFLLPSGGHWGRNSFCCCCLSYLLLSSARCSCYDDLPCIQEHLISSVAAPTAAASTAAPASRTPRPLLRLPLLPPPRLASRTPPPLRRGLPWPSTARVLHLFARSIFGGSASAPDWLQS